VDAPLKTRARFVIERRLFADDFSIYKVAGPRKLPVIGADGESMRFPTQHAAATAFASMLSPITMT